MTEEESQKEMQQKYLELYYMEQNVQQYQTQLEALIQQLGEIDMIIEGINSIEKKGPDTEILVPISNGIFAKAKLTDTDKLIVNVGGDVAVTKDIKSSKELIERQKTDLKNAEVQINTFINMIKEQSETIQLELQKMIKES